MSTDSAASLNWIIEAHRGEGLFSALIPGCAIMPCSRAESLYLSRDDANRTASSVNAAGSDTTTSESSAPNAQEPTQRTQEYILPSSYSNRADGLQDNLLWDFGCVPAPYPVISPSLNDEELEAFGILRGLSYRTMQGELTVVSDTNTRPGSDTALWSSASGALESSQPARDHLEGSSSSGTVNGTMGFGVTEPTPPSRMDQLVDEFTPVPITDPPLTDEEVNAIEIMRNYRDHKMRR